jgi:hypothetical protein
MHICTVNVQIVMARVYTYIQYVLYLPVLLFCRRRTPPGRRWALGKCTTARASSATRPGCSSSPTGPSPPSLCSVRPTGPFSSTISDPIGPPASQVFNPIFIYLNNCFFVSFYTIVLLSLDCLLIKQTPFSERKSLNLKVLSSEM